MGLLSAIVLATLVTTTLRNTADVPAPRTPLAALLAQHGPPAFTAEALRVEGKPPARRPA